MTTLFKLQIWYLYCVKDKYLLFLLLLFDKNSLNSSRDMVFFVTSTVNIFESQIIFSGGLSGIKNQEFPRFSIMCVTKNQCFGLSF